MEAGQRGGGRQRKEGKTDFTGYFRLPPKLRHFPSFSPAWPVKCAAISFWQLPLSTGGCPYHLPSCNPAHPTTPRIPFILISRSSGFTCHLLSSFCDKYRLIIITLTHCHIILLIIDSLKYHANNG